MGCGEMVMVSNGKIEDSRANNAIEQWEKRFAQASRVSLNPVAQQQYSANGASDEQSPTASAAIESTVTTKATLAQRGEMEFMNGKVVYIGNFAISNSYRRRGSGSKRIVESCRWSHTLWWTQCVWLHVASANDLAVELCEKLGVGCYSQDPVWVEHVGRRQRLLLCIQHPGW